MKRFAKNVIDWARVHKLPTWAQGLITMLDQNLNEADRAFDELAGKIGETPIIVNRYGPDRFCLKADAVVRFMLGKDEYVDVRIDREDPNILVLNSRHRITVEPRAANLIFVNDKPFH